MFILKKLIKRQNRQDIWIDDQNQQKIKHDHHVIYSKYIENSQNRQEISLFIKQYFCYNTMTKGYINITDRGMIYVIYRKSHEFI